MSKLALGTVQFGLRYGVGQQCGPMDITTVAEILEGARSGGIAMLDTAPSYGLSETLIGDASPHDFDVVTKISGFSASDLKKGNCSRIRQQINLSLQRLRRPTLYGLLLHNIDAILGAEGGALWAEIQNLKSDGLVEKVGASIYDVAELEAVVEFGMDIVQLPCNVLDARISRSGALKKLKSNGIEVHARSVFLQGLLLASTKTLPSYFEPWHETLHNFWDWCEQEGVTPLEASLRYAIGIEEIDKVVVGVDTPTQLDELLCASTGILPEIPSELQTFEPGLLDPRLWH